MPNGAYRLEFGFAGDVLPHNLGPPPHHVPSFKSMEVFWDGRKVGTVVINSLDKTNVGMDWDRATYLLNATSTAATLVIMSTTRGRSGLAVTNFHLYNVTGLPNGGLPPPTTIHPRPRTIDTGSGEDEAVSAAAPAPGGQKRRGHSGVGVLLALLSVAALMGVGAAMVLSGRAAGINVSDLSFLSRFWRGVDDGYGVLGVSHGGGMGGAGSGYQSHYQQGAVELPTASASMRANSGGGGGWNAAVKEGSDGDDDEVLYARAGLPGGESKRDGLNGTSGSKSGGGGGGKGGRKKGGGAGSGGGGAV